MKKKKGLLIIELKGFSEITSPLLYRMEKISLQETHIRLKYRNIISDIVSSSKKIFNYTNKKEIGGDTWLIEYSNVEDAIKSACFILQLAYQEVIKRGLFYIKPVIAVGEAKPVYEGDRFVDNDSINIYRIADSGDPFSLYLYNHSKVNDIDIIECVLNEKLEALRKNIEFEEINWREIVFTQEQLILFPSFYLSSLLHENDIAYFKTHRESYQKFIELQNESVEMHIYGGCVKYNDRAGDTYVRSIFELFQKKECKSNVICYIDHKNTPINNYYWLRVCKILMTTFPDKYIFSFYEIDFEKIKPLSYHIYNEEYILINLRDYDLSTNQTALKSSVLIRNKSLAKRFIIEFVENFRNIKSSSDKMLDTYIQSINISQKEKEEVESYISSLIN